MNYPQLRDFQVRFINGQIIYEPIENINQLSEIIQLYGREYITKISFYFHNSHQHFHNLILRNSDEYVNDRFIVEFGYYYNQYGEKTELTFEQCYQDFQAVINIINNNNNLSNILLPFIINPFIVYPNNIT